MPNTPAEEGHVLISRILKLCQISDEFLVFSCLLQNHNTTLTAWQFAIEGQAKLQVLAQLVLQFAYASSGRQDCIHALSYYTVQTLQLLSQSFELSSALQRLIHYKIGLVDMQTLAFLSHLCAQVLDFLALTGSELCETLHFRLQSASLRRNGFLFLFHRRSFPYLLRQLSGLIQGLVQLLPRFLQPILLIL